MRLKSFHGPTLTEAMRSVRDALGENAIIVATREDETTGGIRVTAAIDDTSPKPSHTSKSPCPDGSDALEDIANALTRHKVHSTLAEKLMATATQYANDDPLVSLGAAIDTHFKFAPLDTDGIIMLVGPPGAGKTLSTAKLATQATLSKQKAIVVTTDVERAGGIEQLASFTRLMNLGLIEIDDWHALRDLIAVEKHSPIYIDTSGVAPFTAKDKETVRHYIDASKGATLVLPAEIDASEGIELAQEFKSIGATSLMFTRMDTVRRMGGMLRIACESALPLACYCASSKVTEPVNTMNPVVIGRFILGTANTRAKYPDQSCERALSAAGGAR